MGTLESRYADRLRQFGERADRLRSEGRDASAVAAEEIEYVLDSVPFIREYSSTRRVDASTSTTTSRDGGLDGFVEVTHKSNRNNVLQRYLMHVEKQVDPTTMAAAKAHGDLDSKRHPKEADFFCKECDAGMRYHSREAMLVCPSCGACKPHMEMNATNLTYEQEVHQDVITYFAYKRLNHFCEWLNSLQAKVRAKIFFAHDMPSFRMNTFAIFATLLVITALVIGIVALVKMGRNKRQKKKHGKRPGKTQGNKDHGKEHDKIHGQLALLEWELEAQKMGKTVMPTKKTVTKKATKVNPDNEPMSATLPYVPASPEPMPAVADGTFATL